MATGEPARIQLFASSPSDPLAHRAIDGVHATLHLGVAVTAATFAAIGQDIDVRLSAAAATFPPFLKVIWLTGFWLACAWAVALLIIAAGRHRLRLSAEALIAALAAMGAATIAAGLVTHTAGDVFRHLTDSNGPPVFPPGAIVVTSAVFATMAPYLTHPFRRFGRALIILQVVGSLFLGISEAWGAVAALALGSLAGSSIHVVFGSPGALPTLSRVRAALADLGVETAVLEPSIVRREGVLILRGADKIGELEVKVYGRDAWEGELLADLWRLVWYHGSRRSARLSRTEYVEHEGFMTALAASSGVRVPNIISAGLADNGDALIVARPDGAALTIANAQLTVDQVVGLWRDLERMHSRGVTHRRIDLDRLVVRTDGTSGFGDMSSASVRSDASDKLRDRAQLLALTVLTVGPDAAIEESERALGHDGLAELIPYFQDAIAAPMVRSGLHKRRVELDAVRKALVERLDAPADEMVKLRRVTWKSLLNVVLLAVAAYTLIGLIAGIDFGAFARALSHANWWWLGAALLIGQTPRVANAVSTMGSSMTDMPLGPTTALQFATCYVNLAVPSSAGRVAITTRYFQRFGVPPATALSAGVIDSLSEFLTQLVLFVLVFFVSDIDLGMNFSTDQLSGLATTALVVVVVIVVASLIALLVPAVRAKVTVALHQAREALNVLRIPRKLVELFGGNLMSQVLFAVTLGATARAFGYNVPLSSLILINTAVGLFAGLLPIPGGVGVSEAGLALGLTRAGVPSDTSFAIALGYRFCVFYLPPVWGFATYRWMLSRRYL